MSSPPTERGPAQGPRGLVVSDKMDKTVVVGRRGPGEAPPVRQGASPELARLKAHDEANSAGVGDRVRIMETRPLSATKRWRLVEILEKAK